MIPYVLMLEDGRSFVGKRFGAPQDSGGEVAFNTAMTGYQAVLGDPSYAEQMVVMTYPMMGNYGIPSEACEAKQSHVSALFVKEVSRVASNWRHDRTLDAYLRARNVTGLCDVDTRALVRHLRDKGAQRGLVGDAQCSPAVLVQQARQVPPTAGRDLTAAVCTRPAYAWREPSPLVPQPHAHAPAGVGPAPHVVVLDFGVKCNILRRLVDVGCAVTVVPGQPSAADVLQRRPNGVLLSNGPSDPTAVTYGVATVR